MQAHLMRCINDELSQHAKQKGISASHQKLYVTMESTVKKVVGRKKSNCHDEIKPALAHTLSLATSEVNKLATCA